MECAECERGREPNERGWVLLLPSGNEPRILYCPECFADLVRSAAGGPKQDDDKDD